MISNTLPNLGTPRLRMGPEPGGVNANAAPPDADESKPNFDSTLKGRAKNLDDPQEKPQKPIELKQEAKRQKSVQKFMDSCESDFGIAPQRIVEAMSNLNPEEQMAPPEKTAQAVVSQLGLTPNEESKVLVRYHNMLNEMTRPDGPALYGANRNLGYSGRTELVNHSLDRMRDQFFVNSSKGDSESVLASQGLLQGIEQDADSYAEAQARQNMQALGLQPQPQSQSQLLMRNGKSAQMAASTESQRLSQNTAANFNSLQARSSGLDENLNAASTEDADGDALAATLAGLGVLAYDPSEASAFESVSPLATKSLNPKSGQLAELMKQSQAQRLAVNERESALAKSSATDLVNPQSTDDLVQALAQLNRTVDGLANATSFKAKGTVAINGQGGADVAEAVDSADAAELGGFGELSFAASDSKKSDEGLKSLSAKGEKKSGSEKEEFFAKSEPQKDQPITNSKDPFFKTNEAQAAANKGTAMKSADQIKNIQNLVHNTQSLAKAGGGEMKVRLTPEGLGTLDLKVQVTDGKVNVQVATQSKEAKELIENSLGDLKHHLSSHNMTVEKFKVDLGHGSDSLSSNTRGFEQDSSSSDLGRENARQFLGQFRENNFQNRGAYFEAPGMKPYRPKVQGELGATTSVGSAGPRPRNFGEAKGQGLNLVA